MRVLLIQSPLGRRQELAFPIGLAYLAQALGKHEVTVFDPNTAERPFLEMQRVVEEARPEVVGVSLRNVDTTQSWDVFSYLSAFEQAIKKIKEVEPSAKIVTGGAGFSMFPTAIVERVPEIDYGVFLEGEHTLPELLENLDHPERVSGIYLRRENEVFFTGCSRPVDFDKLPAPERDLPGLNLKRYKDVSYSMGIQTKRGCVLRCSYCTYPLLQGRYVRARSPKRVVDEIEHIQNLYGIDEISFSDTVFNFPPEHSERICGELNSRKLGVKWKAWFRENFMNKASMIDALKAGCQLFEYSPDGASPEALRVLQKGISTKDILRIVEIANQLEEAKVAFNFMCNVPGESIKTIASFLRLLTAILARCREKLEFLGLTRIRIYPNTRIHKIALRQGIVSPKNDLLAPTFYNPSPFNVIYSIVLSAFDRKNLIDLASPRTVQNRLARIYERQGS